MNLNPGAQQFASNECCEAWPYRVEVEGQWVKGWYHCPVCHTEWYNGYHVNIANLV